ncbi:hypothetical protein O181_012140 [Austropuccinia psidii MF-1]|uniref:Reverse transcriptase/retrotransposon-derived protein RNase H-like domain-containing protein n=1 Tax=Austropuccinia psidii MF-1 TaxID=1389203 RepID=A0A9Q3BXC3_9BASI|nr:hypothetical protein [Austropuccinia psidii MF-1]
MSELPEKIPLLILNSNESASLFITHYTMWVVDLPSLPSFEWDFFIIDSPKGEDLILGYCFLYNYNPIIVWENGLITYDSSGIISSTSNEFSIAFNSVALAGEIKTHSLPPSIHIPSIIPSQSLLPSRDEIFKEIKDVGEDVAISSLHLFQGDMDLSPLYFYSSLEKKWDDEEEPEEIENLLKVVPPAYHQYLDVFSKVKPEKPPPHCTCDNHIKLEGLLPPVVLSTLYQGMKGFTTDPILSHFNPALPTIVETDASDYSFGAVMSQVNDSGKHPIAFDSHKPLPGELNYEVHDKELLGIVWAVKRWRAFLLSLSDPFEAHWAKFLSEFHFTITYPPGRLATLPDDLSHWDNMYPERGLEFIRKNTKRFNQVFKKNEIKESRFFSIKVEVFSDLVDQFQKAVWQDKVYNKLIKKLERGELVSDYSL